MKKLRLLTVTTIALACSPVFADGDADAGQKQFEEECERCHYSDDFAEEAKSVIAAMIKAIISGETRHRSSLSGFTDEEIANLAEFLASQ